MLRAIARDVSASPGARRLLERCSAWSAPPGRSSALYLVGGYPRDRAIEAFHGLARPRGDLDLLVTGLDEGALAALAADLERALEPEGFRVRPDVGRAFPVIKLAGPGVVADLAPARSRQAEKDPDPAAVTLAQDLARRDFTVDSVAVRVGGGGPDLIGALEDPHGGLADVRRGRITAVGSPEDCFRDDPLRMYRAVRLEAELGPAGFEIDDATAVAVGRLAAELAPGLPAERVIHEVERAVRSAPATALDRLSELELLQPLALPGCATCGGEEARTRAAALLTRIGAGPRAVLWGVLLSAAGLSGRDEIHRLRLPKRAGAVRGRLDELRRAARGGELTEEWLERCLEHRLKPEERDALLRLFGGSPLDPAGRLARTWDRVRGQALEAHVEDARRVARALGGGMPRRLALPPLRRRLRKLLRTVPSRWEAALTGAGLLATVLPEVEAMRGVPQPPEYHAEGDVLRHTVLALEALAAHYPEADEVLVLAVLLHDVGKPETLRLAEETGDRIRFHGHDRVGAEHAAATAEDLGLEAHQVRDVAWLVRNHIAFFDALGSMRAGRAARVFGHRRFVDLLRLHHCDCLSSLRPDGDGDLSSLRRAVLRYGEYLADQARERRRDAEWARLRAAGIDGWTLKDRLGLGPGPAVGRCLEALREALRADPGLEDEALWEVARTFADRGDEP